VPDVRVLALVVVVMLLFSPIAWIWTYVWMIVPLAMLLMGRQRVRGVAWPLLLVAAILMSVPISRQPVSDSLTMIGGAIAAVLLLVRSLGLLDEREDSLLKPA
jgi:hypothetical protein